MPTLPEYVRHIRRILRENQNVIFSPREFRRLLNEWIEELRGQIASIWSPEELARLEERIDRLFRELEERMYTYVDDNIRRGAENIMSGVDAYVRDPAFLGTIDPQALDLQHRYTMTLIRNITQDTQRRVLIQLRTGLAAGKSVEWMMQLIGRTVDSGIFRDVMYRAELIARTETGRLLNLSAMQAIREYGKIRPNAKKMWVHSGIVKTARPHHMALHGTVIPHDAKFQVGDYLADGPHDPNLPASEVCNCRCAVVPVPPDMEERFAQEAKDYWEQATQAGRNTLFTPAQFRGWYFATTNRTVTPRVSTYRAMREMSSSEVRSILMTAEQAAELMLSERQVARYLKHFNSMAARAYATMKEYIRERKLQLRNLVYFVDDDITCGEAILRWESELTRMVNLEGTIYRGCNYPLLTGEPIVPLRVGQIVRCTLTPFTYDLNIARQFGDTYIFRIEPQRIRGYVYRGAGFEAEREVGVSGLYRIVRIERVGDLRYVYLEPTEEVQPDLLLPLVL